MSESLEFSQRTQSIHCCKPSGAPLRLAIAALSGGSRNSQDCERQEMPAFELSGIKDAESADAVASGSIGKQPG